MKKPVSLCLPADISDDAVREHFSVCGDIVGVRIVRDRKTGLGKGFGYVLFEVCVSAVPPSESALGFAFYISIFFTFYMFDCYSLLALLLLLLSIVVVYNIKGQRWQRGGVHVLKAAWKTSSVEVNTEQTTLGCVQRKAVKHFGERSEL